MNAYIDPFPALERRHALLLVPFVRPFELARPFAVRRDGRLKLRYKHLVVRLLFCRPSL